MRCKYASGSGFNKPSSVSNYEILVLAKAIKNRCIKVVIELRVEQFWSEIIFAVFVHAISILKSRVLFQTKLHSTQFNYHY